MSHRRRARGGGAAPKALATEVNAWRMLRRRAVDTSYSFAKRSQSATAARTASTISRTSVSLRLVQCLDARLDAFLDQSGSREDEHRLDDVSDRVYRLITRSVLAAPAIAFCSYSPSALTLSIRSNATSARNARAAITSLRHCNHNFSVNTCWRCSRSSREEGKHHRPTPLLLQRQERPRNA